MTMTRQGKMMAAFLGVLLILLAAAVYGTSHKAHPKRDTLLTAEEEALRYPYSTLDDREKALYTALYRGMTAHEEEIPLPDTFRDIEYERIYLLVTMQEPELFYVSNMYELKSVMDTAHIQYSMTRENAERRAAQLELAADNILKRISPTQTDAQKLLMIHDAIAQSCAYAELGHYDDAIGPLTEGYALCEGYAKAFLYVARRGGMQAMCVTGKSWRGELHVWNVARINGKYYNIDVTWDDDDSYMGNVAHSCFAVPDRMFTDHKTDLTAYQPPACTDTAESYYRQRGLVLSEQGQLAGKLQEWSAYGTGGIMEFQCSTDAVYRAVKKSLREDSAMKAIIQIGAGGRSSRINFDDTRQVVSVVYL